MLIIAGLTIAGCGLFSDDENGDDAVETPTVVVTPDERTADDDVSDPTPVPDADDQATPEVDENSEATPDPDTGADETPVEPDEFRLVSAAGEQAGKPRSYFWADAQELVALEMDGHYIPLQDEPLAVESGEELGLEAEQDDLFPEEIHISVYPREGNFEENVGTRDGYMDAFYPHTEPVLTDTIDPENPLWIADLEPGEYFVLIETHWPTPEGWPKDRWAEYGYWLLVG
jgi:hypothetical protein